MIVNCYKSESDIESIDSLIAVLEHYKEKFDGVFATITTDTYYKTYDVRFSWTEEK